MCRRHSVDWRRAAALRLQSLSQDHRFTGGVLLAVVIFAVALANSPAAGWYEGLRTRAFGPAVLGLRMTAAEWASDGLLVVFFFVVGLELKQEIVVGRLRSMRIALVPVIAACGGVLVPALVFVLFNLESGPDALRGWAIPTATDIAFAIAVYSLFGRLFPSGVRVFLLTLAVVDDLIAIVIIAAFYAHGFSLLSLTAAFVPLAAFGWAVQHGVRRWWVLLPLGVFTWYAVHASGIHATIAGVALALTVPVRPGTKAWAPLARATRDEDVGERGYQGMASHLEMVWGPVSALLVVPIFAFFSAGVRLGGWEGLGSAFSDTVALGILVGLVMGKPIGILGATFLVTRTPSVRASFSLPWRGLVGTAMLGGIGFTVSLLVGELSYGDGSLVDNHVKVAVLSGSLLSAIVGGAVLAVVGRAGSDRADHLPCRSGEEDS